MTLHITPEEYKVIAAIVAGQPPCYAFGSRVAGTHKRFSDLDLCLKGEKPIEDDVMAELKGKFSESDLPYKVDVVDYHRISSSFRSRIEESWVLFHP